MPFQLFPFLPLHPLKFSFFPWCAKRQISKPPYPPKKTEAIFPDKKVILQPKRRNKANSFPSSSTEIQRLKDFFSF